MLKQRDIVDAFNYLYYGQEMKSPILNSTHWMGHQIVKAPTDLHSYQEILWETRPDVIIETGTFKGGSALWFAHMAQLMDLAQVISIDIHNSNNIPSLPKHEKLIYLSGSSASQDVISATEGRIGGVRERLGREPKVMVVLDSDHRMGHVLQELDLYSNFVSPGCYLIVEDSNINGHPVLAGWGKGPMEALEAWLPKHPEFTRDAHRERFLLTMNPKGYLKRGAV